MRSIQTIATVALLSTLVAAGACSSELDHKPSAKVEDAPAADAVSPTEVATTLALDASTSKVEFVGAKVSGDHRGEFGEPSGSIQLDEAGKVVGMQVQVDTTALEIAPEKLQQHLSGPDFFDVEKYPTASFKLVSLDGPNRGEFEVKGDLELRGITKRISFPAKGTLSKSEVTTSASFKINRKDFGITYAGMADDLIKDEVLLELDLEFRAG